MKSGFVAVAGRPNVGKSTLVNALCGGKVAIVSDKPQTTRRRIAGVANGDGFQLALVDLPGFQRPLDPLTERMQRTVDQAFEGVDAVLFVLSARERIGAGDRFIAERVFSLRVPVVIALNKVDRLKPGHIATQMETASKLGDFHALHPVSAKTGDGIAELREELVELLPEGPAYFPPDQRSDLPLEDQVGELVREKALALTKDEIPHALKVGNQFLFLYDRRVAFEGTSQELAESDVPDLVRFLEPFKISLAQAFHSFTEGNGT